MLCNGEETIQKILNFLSFKSSLIVSLTLHLVMFFLGYNAYLVIFKPNLIVLTETTQNEIVKSN
jgi:hypothetical protein